MEVLPGMAWWHLMARSAQLNQAGLPGTPSASPALPAVPLLAAFGTDVAAAGWFPTYMTN